MSAAEEVWMEPDKKVANPAGAEESVAGESTEEEVDWQKKSEDLEAKLKKSKDAFNKQTKETERNIRRQSSSLQTQINSANARASQVEDNWATKFHQERMSGMEEAEALRYENSLLLEQADKARNETSQVREAAARAASAAGYVRHFGAMGISEAELNTSGSLQELADSGYARMEERETTRSTKMDEYASRLEKQDTELAALRAGNPDPNALAEGAGDLKPPAVATHTPGANAGERTMLQAQESAKQYFGGQLPSEEQLYRAVETGMLPQSVLPGLEGMPKDE